MDFRRIAEEEEQEDAMAEPLEIPDVAAEAAQGGVASLLRDADRPLPQPDMSALGALIEEIEACRRILGSAKE
jgi:hypothetical protein